MRRIRQVVALALALAAALLLPAGAWAQPVLPTLPQATVDTTMPAITGTTFTVGASGDLQGALDSAAASDPNLNHLITVNVNNNFGTISLPARAAGSGWIVVRSANIASLPVEGRRVAVADASNMPIITAPAPPANAITDAGSTARHYRFIGFDIRGNASVKTTAVIILDEGHHFIFDRCLIRGDPTLGARRGVQMNAGNTAVIHSRVWDFKENGADSQAIAAWNMPSVAASRGPLLIDNNYLEGGGENVLFGGVDSSSDAQIPEDITVTRNHIAKNPAHQAQTWTEKNLFELKSVRRILVERNLFENHWLDAQSHAIVFTVRNQSGGANWSTVQDATFRYNLIRDIFNAYNHLGEDDAFVSVRMTRVHIHDNLWLDMAGHGGTSGAGQEGSLNMTWDHNTMLNLGTRAFAFSLGVAEENWKYQNSIWRRQSFGIKGDLQSEGNNTINTYMTPGGVFTTNALIAGNPVSYNQYPGNHFPATDADVQFIDLTNNDLRLASGSPLKGVGTRNFGPVLSLDIGADVEEVFSQIGWDSTSGRNALTATFSAVTGLWVSVSDGGRPPVSSRPAVGDRPAVFDRPPVVDRPPVP